MNKIKIFKAISNGTRLMCNFRVEESFFLAENITYEAPDIVFIANTLPGVLNLIFVSGM